MKRFAIITAILGLSGVTLGAFGAHGIRGSISDYHYQSYRIGIEYLFFHLAPLLYISTQKRTKCINLSGIFFSTGIIFFTYSDLLLATEAIHKINLHFLWPVTPLGGVLLMMGWGTLLYSLLKKDIF